MQIAGGLPGALVAGQPQPAQPAPGTKRKWTTPRRLRAFLSSILVGAALLLLVGEGTLTRARQAMKTIGRDAAPSVIAAQEITANLADLDANAAGYLLGAVDGADVATQLFEFRRAGATKRLVDAAQKITYGDAEKIPIIAMFENLGRYLEITAQARFRHDHGDLPGALDSYRIATDLMHRRIIPEANNLDAANKQQIERMYESQKGMNTGSESLALFVGAGLTFVLLWSQVFLLRSMRRVLNVPLAVATILTVVFSGYLLTRFDAAENDLKIAKLDAFDSIHTLWQIRAIAYDASGDEMRFLLDPERAHQQDSVFRANVALLTSEPTFPQKYRELVHHYEKVKDMGMHGLIADELSNITFRGEEDAALAMADAFATYYAADAKVRKLEKDGKHAEALEVATGSKDDEAPAAFDRFDEATQRTLLINKDVFDQVVADGDRGLRRAEYLDPGFAFAIALLGWLGLRPRLREYR